jgi:primosomal protein N' (replication factor Y)
VVQKTTILHIAVPSPLHRLFDYTLPSALDKTTLQPGVRVNIPFGRQRLVGVLIDISDKTDIPSKKLKPITAVLDKTPVLSNTLLRLAQFASDYYHYPIGEVCAAMLPNHLRKGEPLLGPQTHRVYCLSDSAAAESTIKRGVRQQQLWHAVNAAMPAGLSEQHSRQLGIPKTAITALLKKGLLIEKKEKTDLTKSVFCTKDNDNIVLNEEQTLAINAIVDNLSHFTSYLLQGVTGSGKTEVYLQVINAVLAQNKQALLLVPEIGLTPQAVSRIQQRFPVCTALLHSGLTDRERQLAWEQAANGEARIVIGTRSALFTPLKDPGVIIIDEEHDLSFKQQDGFRYSARDLAVFRAKLDNVPIMLGSATPSLESIQNAQANRYQWLHLTKRAGNAGEPTYHLIDLRAQPLHTGIAIELRDKMTEQLTQGHQVLVFLNRRGYAPVLICHDCGWSAQCSQCDARMTLHSAKGRLQCHHCGLSRQKPTVCPDCQSDNIVPLGIGTERVATALIDLFPSIPVLRIDSDTTRSKGAMQHYVETIQQGQPCILLGTQMLAKGHHFPNVTMVAVLEADSGLYSADFRATERLAQLLWQVGGRAGRAEKPGYVFIQTHMPQHPLLQQLLQSGFSTFANSVLQQRQQTGLPPFGCMALLRAESAVQQRTHDFLSAVKQRIHDRLPEKVDVLGPIPAAMARRAGVYRMQLLLQSEERTCLQRALTMLVSLLNCQKKQSGIRWIIDVDPQDVL